MDIKGFLWLCFVGVKSWLEFQFRDAMPLTPSIKELSTCFEFWSSLSPVAYSNSALKLVVRYAQSILEWWLEINKDIHMKILLKNSLLTCHAVTDGLSLLLLPSGLSLRLDSGRVNPPLLAAFFPFSFKFSLLVRTEQDWERRGR